MMGAPPASSLLAWFLENVAVVAVGSAALAVVLKASGIFAHSDALILFLFLLAFGVSAVTLSYLLSACFGRAAPAALCGSLLYLASFLPYIVLLVLRGRLSTPAQMLLVSEAGSAPHGQQPSPPPSLPFPQASFPRPPRRELLWLRGPAGAGGRQLGWVSPHSPPGETGRPPVPTEHGQARGPIAVAAVSPSLLLSSAPASAPSGRLFASSAGCHTQCTPLSALLRPT